MTKVGNTKVSQSLIENVNTISTLQSKVDLLNQTIGSQQETINSHGANVSQLRKEYEDKVKEVRVISTTKSGKQYDSWGDRIYSPPTVSTTYKNLDTVIADIRKEESSKLKLSTVELEGAIEDKELLIVKLRADVTRINKTKEDELTDAKSKLRERYNKLIEGHTDEIKELKEEIVKVKKSKTDEELDKKRKEEIADLNERIIELEEEIKVIGSMNFFKRAFRAMTLNSKKAQKATAEKRNRIDNIVGRRGINPFTGWF